MTAVCPTCDPPPAVSYSTVAVAWKRSALGLTIGRGLDAASRWLLVVLLARWTSIADLGAWAIATAIAAPVFTLLELRLRWLAAAGGVAEATARHYWLVRGATIGVAMIGVGAAWPFLGDRYLASLLVMVFAAKSIELASELAKGLAQHRSRTGAVAVGSGLRGVMGLVGAMIGLHYVASALAAVTGLTLAWAAVFLFWDLPLAGLWHGPLRFRPRWRTLWSIVTTATPVAIASVLTGLGRILPRWALALWHPRDLVGIFTALAALAAAGDIFVSSMAHAAIAPLGRLATRDSQRHRRLVWELVGAAALLGLIGTVVAAAAGSHLLESIYGPTFRGYGLPLALLALGMTFAFVNGILQVALVSLRAGQHLPRQIAAGVIAAVAVAILLVPAFPLIGAAATTLAMTATNTISLAWRLARSYREHCECDRKKDESSSEGNLLRLVIAVSPTASSLEQFTRRQCQRWRVTVGSFLTPAHRLPDGVAHFSGDGRVWRFVRRLSHHLRSHPVDVIHVHAPHLTPFWLAASWLAGRPWLARRVVYHIHSCWQHYSWRNRFLCVLSCLVSARVIACSHTSFQSLPRPLRSWLGRRLHVVPNGVDVDRADRLRRAGDHRQSELPLRLAVVATLRPIKNVELILEAARRLPASRFQWTIVGGGPLESKLRRQVEAWRIGDRVRFTGRIDRDEVLTILWQSDLLVSASLGEGLPVAVLEALAAECPVVCSDIPPHRELDPQGDVLIFFDHRRAEQLVEALERWWELSPEERRRRSRDGRRLVQEKYDVDRMLTACEEVYARVANVRSALQGRLVACS